MKKITAIRKGPGKSVSIFLDGNRTFCLSAAQARQERLQIGEELAEDRIEALATADRAYRCQSAALRLLSYRPRSEAELRARLEQRGFAPAGVEDVISRLRQQGLVDDAAFARFWVENRESFRPRSRSLAALELRRKGIAGEVAAAAVAGENDEDGAYRAARRRVRVLAGAGRDEFRRRLVDYLRRRGFGFRVIARTVARLWQETRGEATNEVK